MVGLDERLARWIPGGAPELALREIHVWLAGLDPDPKDFQSMDEILSQEERDRAALFRITGGRERYTMGRGFLRLLLGQYLKRNPAELVFAYNSFGKPSLVELGDPNLVRRLGFNLSHSAGLALLAFSWEGELGVDIEKYREEVIREKLAERFFSATETEELTGLDPGEQLSAFFNCWTRKEAYIKARGDGLSRSLSSFAVSLRPTEPPVLRWCHDDPQASVRWRIWNVQVPSGYAGCLIAPATATGLREFELG